MAFDGLRALAQACGAGAVAGVYCTGGGGGGRHEVGQVTLEQRGGAQLQLDQAAQVRHAVQVDAAAQQAGKVAFDMCHLGRHGDVVAGAGQRNREVAQCACVQQCAGRHGHQRALEREVEYVHAEGLVGGGKLRGRIKAHTDEVAAFVGHCGLLGLAVWLHATSRPGRWLFVSGFTVGVVLLK